MFGFGSKSSIVPTSLDALKYKKAHSFLSRPLSSQILRLGNGETMSYCQVGDSAGISVIWFGGPADNRFIIGLYEEIALEMGIRRKFCSFEILGLAQFYP